jgi:hypothetical protein
MTVTRADRRGSSFARGARLLVLLLPLFALGSMVYVGCAAVPVGRKNYYGAPGSKMAPNEIDPAIDFDDTAEP